NVPDQRGPARPRRQAADGRGGREGPHPVPHDRPCGRAAPGRGAFLRGRLPGATVRRRRKLSVEPRPPCRAGGGAPVRQCRTPALRALEPFRPGLKQSTMHAATIRTRVMLPLSGYRPRCISTRTTLATWPPRPAEAHTLDLPCDDVPDAEAW